MVLLLVGKIEHALTSANAQVCCSSSMCSFASIMKLLSVPPALPVTSSQNSTLSALPPTCAANCLFVQAASIQVKTLASRSLSHPDPVYCGFPPVDVQGACVLRGRIGIYYWERSTSSVLLATVLYDNNIAHGIFTL